MNEWISVTDKTPETPDPVLAVAAWHGEEEPRVYAMCFVYSRWSDDDEWVGGWRCAQGDGFDIPTMQVTHWTPMPTPPPREPQDDEVSRIKFKVQVSSINGWADLKASVDGGPNEVELFDSHAAALADVGDELDPREFRIVPEGTEADDDLY